MTDKNKSNPLIRRLQWTSTSRITPVGNKDKKEQKIYTREMTSVLRGEALWQPHTGINIGDIGYIHDGNFELLFPANSISGGQHPAVSVPTKFTEVIATGVESGELPAGCFHTESVQRIGPRDNESQGFTPLPQGRRGGFTFELTGSMGAALVARHPIHWKESPDSSRDLFDQYLHNNYDHWLELTKAKKIPRGVRPVLVSGFDLAKDFVTVSYPSRGSASLKFKKPITEPMFKSISPPFQGKWCFRSVPHIQERASTECNQCIFVRCHNMRRRDEIPKNIRGAAGPHDLGSGDNEGGTFPELTARSSIGTTATLRRKLFGPPAGDISPKPDTDREVLDDEEYDKWDIIADYIFRNSDAVTALMHHSDLVGILTPGNTEDLPTLLEKRKLPVAVTEGVGKIFCQEIPQPIWHPQSRSQLVNSVDDASDSPPKSIDSMLHSLSLDDTNDASKRGGSASPEPSSTRDRDSQQWESAPAVRLGAIWDLAAETSTRKEHRVGRKSPQEVQDAMPVHWSNEESLSGNEDSAPEIHESILSSSTSLERQDPEPEIQRYIDGVDNRLANHLVPDRERQKLFNELCEICNRYRMIPTSMIIPVSMQDFTEMRAGGSAYVCKSTYEGAAVAVKVFRIRQTSNLDEILSKFCREGVAWKHLRHPNISPLLGVTVTKERLAMVSEWMDNGNINQFVKNNPQANRPMLLVDVANGLRYLHDLQIVHGDLKGANILIDMAKRARIADFGFVTVTGVPTSEAARASMESLASIDSLMSFTSGGTYRWISPELLDPESFGEPQSEGSRPTNQSDCYAFGMVIYEVLCGYHPFVEITSDILVINRVLDGVRPEKPSQAARLGFTEDLWMILERCWEGDRSKRPGVDEILPYLNDAAAHWDINTTTSNSGAPATQQDTPNPSSTGPSLMDEVSETLLKNIDSVALPLDASYISEENGVYIPQRRYGKGTGRNNPENQGMILFLRKDGSHFPLSAALREDYSGLVLRDLPVPGGITLTLRVEWPGYPPQDFQLRGRDWLRTPGRIPTSKLGTEVAKAIQAFIMRMQDETIDPEHAEWRVGPGGIQVEDLRIASLEQVSAGSWQARLFYKPYQGHSV